jgi:hypothetical protein
MRRVIKPHVKLDNYPDIYRKGRQGYPRERWRVRIRTFARCERSACRRLLESDR